MAAGAGRAPVAAPAPIAQVQPSVPSASGSPWVEDRTPNADEINKLNPTYTPGERESTNVEDRRQDGAFLDDANLSVDEKHKRFEEEHARLRMSGKQDEADRLKDKYDPWYWKNQQPMVQKKYD